MSSNFHSVGNLAFYGEWSVDYVYFKSLYKAGVVYNPKNSWWDAKTAQGIAQQAINDATVFSNLNGGSKEDMDEHFLQKLNKIIQFLEEACQYEQKNEIRWAQNMVKKILPLLKGYIKQNKNVRDLITMLEHPSDIDYDKLISLINIIENGLTNTQVIAEHEEARIQEITKTMRRLMKSRRNQASGLANIHQLSPDAKEKSAVAAALRLRDKIEKEYITHGARLDRKTSVEITNKEGKAMTKTNYVLFGGKMFSEVPKTIGSITTDWSRAMIQDIIRNPDLLSKLARKLGTKRSALLARNFKLLEDPVRQAIILAIDQYAQNNLSQLINTEINQNLLQELEKNLLSQDDLFDNIIKINVAGLDNYGQKIKEAELTKDAKSLKDLQENYANELFNLVDKFISSMTTAEQKQTMLYKLLNNPDLNTNKKWDYLNEVITLIHDVEKIKQEAEKMLDEWEQTATNKQREISKEMRLSNNSKETITITISHGKIIIDTQQVIKALDKNPTFQKMNFKSFNPHDLRYTISSLKDRATKDLRETITQSIALNQIKLSEEKIITALNTELRNISIKIDAAKDEEMRHIVQQHLLNAKSFNELSGPLQGKNDGVTILLNFNNYFSNIQSKFGSQLVDEAKQQFSNITKKIEKDQQTIMSQYQASIDKTVKDVNIGKQSQSAERYSTVAFKALANPDNKIDKTYKQLDKHVNEFIELIETNIKLPKGEAKKIGEKIKNIFNNSLYISTTVKNYNTYVNQIGFLGGSLGANFDQQLGQIADIFKNAQTPIDKEDYKWLRSAILNCFPGSVVGEKNKNLIEQYLGSLMAFSLFDEGGAEMAIISDFYKKYFEMINKNDNVNILHLYRVNGVYVPGSFVLKQTLDTLKNQVIPKINEIPNLVKRGAGITIINKTNESVIPNRPIASFYGPPDNNAWSVAGQNASEKVTLQVVFLAGLLDIVKGINKTLGNVDIPK